ncbi:unnamed protein product [Lepidochelys kempii]
MITCPPPTTLRINIHELHLNAPPSFGSLCSDWLVPLSLPGPPPGPSSLAPRYLEAPLRRLQPNPAAVPGPAFPVGVLGADWSSRAVSHAAGPPPRPRLGLGSRLGCAAEE